MRQRLANALHLRREMNHLRFHLEKNPGDADTKRKLDEIQVKLIDMLIDELADQSRDIDSIRAQSGRNRFMR